VVRVLGLEHEIDGPITDHLGRDVGTIGRSGVLGLGRLDHRNRVCSSTTKVSTEPQRVMPGVIAARDLGARIITRT